MSKVSPIKKKIISCSIVAILFGNIFGTTAHAASSYMNDAILSNVTPMGTYSDVTSGARYLYGGNVVFKFRDATKGVPPIFQFAPPSIKAGCNGISVTGGMLSMLGLDGIADQIQNAGTAVVYGILVGLTYSLPGLAEVFKHIRQWAEWLQNLFRNACSAGQKLGTELSKTSAFKDTVGTVSSAMESSIKGVEKVAEEVTLQAGKILPDKLVDFLDEVSSGKKDSTSKDEKNDRSKTASTNFREFFRKIGIANVVLYENEVKNGKFSSDTLYNIQPIMASESSAHELYVILVNMFGDLTLDKATTDFISKHGGSMLSLINDGSTNAKNAETVESNKVMAAYNAAFFQANQGNASPKPATIEYIKPTISAERAAKIFIHGGSFEAKVGEKTDQLEELKQPTLYTAKAPNAANTTEAIYTMQIENSVAPIQWKGLFANSKNRINCEIESKVLNTKCANYFPLVLPGVGKYIETIATIERQGNASDGLAVVPNAQSEALKDDLAQHNAYFFAKFILNYIENDFRGNLLQINNEEQTIAFDKMFTDTKDRIIKELDGMVGKDAEILDSLRQRFINVENQLKEQRMKR